MSKINQNFVLLMEPDADDYRISLKGGNMALNKFCIDEENQFESSGVFYLKKFDDYDDTGKGNGKSFLENRILNKPLTERPCLRVANQSVVDH